MAITKYQSGANFERRVLRYLIGDNTSPTHGYLHTLISAAFSHTPTTPPNLYGLRAAGSRGDFDLIIIGSADNLQWVCGIQCKTKRPSYASMASDLRRIRDQHKINGVYAYREKQKVTFYPELDNVISKLIQ